MTGWRITDEGEGHSYTFPNGYTLAAGAPVAIRSGPGIRIQEALCHRGSWIVHRRQIRLRDSTGRCRPGCGHNP